MHLEWSMKTCKCGACAATRGSEDILLAATAATELGSPALCVQNKLEGLWHWVKRYVAGAWAAAAL